MRYFICFYSGLSKKNNAEAFGSFVTSTEDGKYINAKNVIALIKDGANLSAASITNLIEVNKDDYDEYCK